MAFFNPIENLFFDDKTCFLSGDNLSDEADQIMVFPGWVLEKYNYGNKVFKMMDTVRSVKYNDLKMPCSNRVKEAFDLLDNAVKEAFEGGYDGIKTLDEHKFFLWVGRIVYGTLYAELDLEKKQKEKTGKEFAISTELRRRISYFHLMLQSLISPIEFGDLKPWSITVVKLKYSKDVFHFRDDAVNLLFSLGLNGWGVIVCLQDNGFIKQTYADLLDKIGENVLHPLQFDELCAKYLYSIYLLKQRPKFKVSEEKNHLLITSLPAGLDENVPVFGKWDDEVYSQILADYWKPWGIQKEEIIDFPNPPVSFLEDQVSYDFVNPDTIPFPY